MTGNNLCLVATSYQHGNHGARLNLTQCNHGPSAEWPENTCIANTFTCLCELPQ